MELILAPRVSITELSKSCVRGLGTVTFWSFSHALKFISKKASFPPLGLLTVAAMIPEEWEKKLVDMNITALSDEDIKWADYVFISAMVVQRDSAKEVIDRCKKLAARTVAGGPLFTTGHDEFEASSSSFN